MANLSKPGMTNNAGGRPRKTPLTDALREQRHTLRAMREEQGHAALKALEILMPEEREVLKAYRESKVPTPLKPGEFPPPPKGTEAPLPGPPVQPNDPPRPEDPSNGEGSKS